jgi:hypothetical protein
MLTPPNWCISVALCMSRATCCIDTSENQSGHRRVLGSVEYFWRKASTNRQGTTLARQRLELTPMPTPRKRTQKPKSKDQPAPLKGWQQIAAFLGQPVSVAQRWAKTGMPVARQGRFVPRTTMMGLR